MKKIILYFTLISMFFACTGKSDQSAKSNRSLMEKDTIAMKIPAAYIDTATIVEENVWLRKSSDEGEVIDKINKGTSCYVLKEGKRDTIRGIQDVWYKVSVNNKVGWVFGSQLSIRAARLVDFGQIIDIFMEAYNDKNIEQLDQYVHPQYGISYGFVMCEQEKQNFTDVKSYPDFVSFDTLQHFRTDFPKITCKDPQKKKIPKYLGELKWEYNGCYWNEITNGQVKLVSTDDVYEFYFKAIESSWFLIRIEKIDCR